MKKKTAIKLTSAALAATLIAVPIIKNSKNRQNEKTNSYVKILQVGDHDTKNIPFEEIYIAHYTSDAIDTAVVISPDSENISDICNDVEYVKGLVAHYNVGPIFLDIEKIMTNDDLNISQKINLIETFLNKASENSMYVGLYGTNTNLYELDKYYFDTKKYDTYLIKDENTNKYEGKSSFVQELDGTLTINNYELFEVIKNNNLNKAENLKNDSYYIVGDINELEYIVNNYNISMNDLLIYNNIRKEDINVGTVLRIPNSIQFNNNDRLINQNAIAKGIDISEFQNTNNADWNQIKENIDFIIIRATYGTKVDNSFSINYVKAAENDIPIGIYSYSYANNSNEMLEEANRLIYELHDKNITYPVYLDLEDKSVLEMNGNELVEGITAWTQTIRTAGYIPGIYTNPSCYDIISLKVNEIHPDFLKQFDLWIAGGTDYNKEISIANIEDNGCKIISSNNNIYCNMRQITSRGTEVGIGNSSGHVDINLCYSDYQNYTVTKDFDIKKFNRINIDEFMIYSGLSIIGILVLENSIKLIVKNRKEKKNNNCLEDTLTRIK